jgi:hypothetical protein
MAPLVFKLTMRDFVVEGSPTCRTSREIDDRMNSDFVVNVLDTVEDSHSVPPISQQAKHERKNHPLSDYCGGQGFDRGN